jgi:hypothetical protein
MIGARSIRRLRDLVWRWLLRQAHLHPWRSGSVVQNKPPQIRREHVDDRSEGRIMILSDHRAEPSETSADDAASPGSSAQ